MNNYPTRGHKGESRSRVRPTSREVAEINLEKMTPRHVVRVKRDKPYHPNQAINSGKVTALK